MNKGNHNISGEVSLYCPGCKEKLARGNSCPRCNQRFPTEGNVLILLDENTRKTVAAISSCIISEQENLKNNPRINSYEELPFVPPQALNDTWRSRQKDFYWIRKNITNEGPLSILEVGPWNGWLTHHLCQWGHHVVAVDYFIDDINGLKSHNVYKDSWVKIQANIDRLDIFQGETFDIIIFNNCLQYMSSPVSTYRKALSLLNKRGRIITLGLTISNKPEVISRDFEKRIQNFKNEYGLVLNGINKTKGYVSIRDMVDFKSIGMKLKSDKYNMFENAKIFLRRLLNKPTIVRHNCIQNIRCADN